MTTTATLPVLEMSSPLGPLVLATAGRSLRLLAFGSRGEGDLDQLLGADLPVDREEDERLLEDVRARLRAYFEGELRALDGIPADPLGTAFQTSVWKALRTIPAGKTASYGEIARKIGRESACRAVGAANGRNPVAIVIPCHRVIGSNGTLTGYGGGLDRKSWLLRHEGALERELFS
jgi:methylated-DNA-[protein]-cysteine S-methyltransferase